MGVLNDFTSASRWGKLLLATLLVGIALLLVGFFTLDWASGQAVETRDYSKNVMYSKNLSDTFHISSRTGLWEFCTKLTFKKKSDKPDFFNRDMLQKSVSGCRKMNVEHAWITAVQTVMTLSIPFSFLSLICLCLYIFNLEKHRHEKTAIATGIFSLITDILMFIGVLVFGVCIRSPGLELSQFDCYYLDKFVFSPSDLSWSFWATCISAVIFLAATTMAYFLTLRTRQRERMRRRSERRSTSHQPRLLSTQNSQMSDSVFAS